MLKIDTYKKYIYGTARAKEIKELGLIRASIENERRFGNDKWI